MAETRTPEVQELEKEALDLLSNNYEGDDNNYEGDEYTGFNDDSIDFETAGFSSFADEGKKGLSFTFTITNNETSAVDREIALLPGYFTTAAEIKDANGSAVAAILTDGTVVGTQQGANRLIATGKPKNIQELLYFVKNNPTRFTGLKMLVDDPLQLENDILIRQLSPFRNLGDNQITPSHYKDSTQLDTKRVEIPLQDFQMDDQTVIIYTISAGRTVTFNFFAGAIANTSGALARKAKKARTNLVKIGFRAKRKKA